MNNRVAIALPFHEYFTLRFGPSLHAAYKADESETLRDPTDSCKEYVVELLELDKRRQQPKPSHKRRSVDMPSGAASDAPLCIPQFWSQNCGPR